MPAIWSHPGAHSEPSLRPAGADGTEATRASRAGGLEPAGIVLVGKPDDALGSPKPVERVFGEQLADGCQLARCSPGTVSHRAPFPQITHPSRLNLLGMVPVTEMDGQSRIAYQIEPGGPAWRRSFHE
jgi:hypothetical protein